jgi:hypothetical protein
VEGAGDVPREKIHAAAIKREEAVVHPKEIPEMRALLASHGYDPAEAEMLSEEGMGPEELGHRLRTAPSGVGSLNYTHGLRQNPALGVEALPAPIARSIAKHGVIALSSGPRKAVVSKEGMLKGYWKVVLTDGTLIETGMQSKKFAQHVADEVNRRGEFNAGISGFRRMEKL